MNTLLPHVPRTEARAAILSVVVGIVLLLIKFVAYFMTGSAAIFSDALESIVNVAASLVAAYSLSLAHSPADRDHPYGHGKVEFLSAGFEGGMILLAAIVIAAKAIDALLFRELHVEKLGTGMLLLALAMLINGVVGLYLIRTGRRQNSMTLEADGHHLLSDAVTSAAALIALLIVRRFHQAWVDPIAAIFIAGYISWVGLGLLRRSAAGLMDEQDKQEEVLLRRILDAHVGPSGQEPRICSYHKLRHRHSGRFHWVDFHIMVPRSLTVEQGHAMASSIEYEIELALGEGKATAHIEPCQESPCALGSRVPSAVSSPAPEKQPL